MTRAVDSTHTHEADEGAAPGLDPGTTALLRKLHETSPLSDQLDALTNGIGLRSRELTQVAQVSRATLSRWRKEEGAERPRRLDDLRAIASYMVRTGALRPHSVGGWLRSRNVGLDHQRPLEVIAKGEFPRVLAAAETACGSRAPVRPDPPPPAAAGGPVFSQSKGADPDPPPGSGLVGTPAG